MRQIKTSQSQQRSAEKPTLISSDITIGEAYSFNIKIYPLLLALYPILVLYSHNADITEISHLFVPILISLLGTFLLYYILRLILKNTDRAALLSAISVALFFSYGHVFSAAAKHFFLFFSITGGGTDEVLSSRWQVHAVLSVLYVLIFGIAFLYQFKNAKKPLQALSQVLGVFSLVLLIFPIFEIVKMSLLPASPTGRDTMDIDPAPTAQSSEYPDIYYIILDGYAREDILRTHYNFDNADFLNYLRNRGFAIPANTAANYSWTFLSIPSLLNFEYLDNIQEIQKYRNSSDRRISYSLLRDNRALHFLHSRKYRYIHIGSTWGGTLDNPRADLEFNCSSKLFSAAFHRVLAESTWLKIFESKIANDLADCALESFSYLNMSAKIDGPKFVFAHITMPHHPYLFDRDGNILKRVVLSDQIDRQNILWAQKDKYIDQMIFVNTKVKELIDYILRNAKRKPLIVLQSDHGPNIPALPMKKRRKVRLKNFAALLLPGEKVPPPDTLSPVNSLRFIFNAYLGANFEILPNKYFYSDYRRPYAFTTVKIDN
ncbi:MAG: hypothetical protein GYA55_10860 [SAR324 cluster bacterium]|uniref:Sulfatase N-terminal domain-containing protein n=1 Tax=SAR324 cluster bacterium TaxID=2024889 RepID=A0A7X9FST4_9DELT|nr:hypothetical protein [SAR324 cluster bacterium]